MQNNKNIIEALGITKRYNKITAVDDLNLTVPQGICFGLLGPNGAGKTTLIEIIEDIIEPTAGRVLYQGSERTPSFREQIGIMFQQTALLAFMTVQETLTTFQSLYRQTIEIDELIALCHLDDIRKQMNDKISGGQRQRLLLALALINQPHLLFMDEPSTGLDPQARRNLWDIINQVKSQGKTIILTTHYMEEAQQLCDQVAIMDHGQIIAQGTPEALMALHGGGLNVILPKQSLEGIHQPIPYDLQSMGSRVLIRVENLNQAVEALLGLGVDLTHMELQTPNLETVFLNLTGRRLRE
jgi:ABC-2 type transport system ATP-binding protein